MALQDSKCQIEDEKDQCDEEIVKIDSLAEKENSFNLPPDIGLHIGLILMFHLDIFNKTPLIQQMIEKEPPVDLNGLKSLFVINLKKGKV